MAKSRFPNLPISIRESDQVYALCPTFGLICAASTIDAAILALDDARDSAAELYQRAGWEIPHTLSGEGLPPSFYAQARQDISHASKIVAESVERLRRR